jgi:O-antigen ligase
MISAAEIEPVQKADLRVRTVAALRLLGRVSLGEAILFAPFRYRWIEFHRPAPPIYQDYTNFQLYTSDIFLIAALVFWGCELVLGRRRPKAGPWFLWLPVAGLAGLVLLGSAFSVEPAVTVYHGLRLVLLAGLFFYAVQDIGLLDAVLPAAAIGLLIQATIGIAQFLEQRSAGLQALGEHLLDPAWAGVSVVVSAGARTLRAYGLTDHPNLLGGCLAFALVLLLMLSLRAGLQAQPWIAGLFALGGTALLLTFSRSAWLAFLAGSLLVATALAVTRRAGLLRNLLPLAGAALIVMAPFLWQNAGAIGIRLNRGSSFEQVPQENQSIGERRLLNQAALEITRERPLAGTGLGAYPYVLHSKYPDLPVNVQPAHFTLLAAAAETGLPGASLYLLAVLGPWAALWFRRRQLKFSLALVVCSALLLAVTVTGLFDYYTWLLPLGRIWQWLAWGLWGAAYSAANSTANGGIENG